MAETCESRGNRAGWGRLLWRFTAVPWLERPADITLGMQETLNNLAAVAQTQVNTT
ncbi:hypothetical protein BH23ACT7_BH23ACT7_14880 [soil metagenome]